MPFGKRVAKNGKNVFRLLMEFSPIRGFSLFTPRNVECIGELLVRHLMLLEICRTAIYSINEGNIFIGLTRTFILLMKYWWCITWTLGMKMLTILFDV